MNNKIIVAEVKYEGLGSYHIELDDFKSYNLKVLYEEATNDGTEMESLEETEVTITYKYMDKGKYEKLPEFNGF